jgi:glyoxylase-like metal-dependent hydrolase (beta-lactamase superfamily II)
MTGPGTNTYIVGTDETIVIDPAVPDADYLDAVTAVSGRVSSIVLTHRHPDHVGGVADLVARTGAPVRAWGHDPAGGIAVIPVSDGEILSVGGVSMRVMHAPGHASDHLVLFMKDSASLFAGDNVLGEGTAVIAPPDGDMSAYLETLQKLRGLHADRIYPGHFRPLDDGNLVIDTYIAHRLARERAILEAVKSSDGSLDEIVALAYDDTSPSLHGMARFSATAHLDRLVAEGRIRRQGDRWSADSATQQLK